MDQSTLSRDDWSSVVRAGKQAQEKAEELTGADAKSALGQVVDRLRKERGSGR